ncbi:MAG: GNAT family N-acetyltransferase [Chloroflexota bacterium]|nr:GNAT family N-acetyltransferase [Chloroflexota bacterium]
MSAPFVIRLATENDDAALLGLTGLCPMGGTVELGVDRAPRFLALNALQGNPWFVAVGVDRNGEIVGCAAAAVRDVYVDGQPVRASYVSDLRVAPRARRSTLLPLLHRYVIERLAEHGVDLAYATIVEGNRAAESMRGRRRLPRYMRLGRIRVAAVTGARGRPARTVTVETPRCDDVSALARLLDTCARSRDFAPAWSSETLARALAVTPGLTLERVLVVRRHGETVAMLAAWDQSALHRRRVLAYHGGASMYRRLHDIRAVLRRRPTLPRPGEILRELHVTHIAVADDDPDLFAALLREAWRRFSPGYHFLTFGLAEGHPLLAALEDFEYGAFHTVAYAIPQPASAWEHHTFARLPFHEISHL